MNRRYILLIFGLTFCLIKPELVIAYDDCSFSLQMSQQMMNRAQQNTWNMINNMAITNMVIAEQIRKKEDCSAQEGVWEEGKCYITASPEPSVEPTTEPVAPVYIPPAVVVRPSSIPSPSPSPSPAIIKPGPALEYEPQTATTETVLFNKLISFVKNLLNF